MVSIITVVRNGVRTIEQTILSVINQDYSDYEYIIIDGVSTDGTCEILDKYTDKISKIRSEPDTGIYDAMNKGISLAEGDWIYFLGCDDEIYDKSTLSNIFSTSTYENYDVIYGNVLFRQTNEVFDGKFDFNKHALKSICQQAIFYRSELFQKYGHFNAEFLTAADYVFNMSVFCADISKWLYVDTIIAKYSETGASSYSHDKEYQKRCFAIRYDNFRPYVSKYVLSRIFYSSFLKFFLSHSFYTSLKYLFLVFKDVGTLRHIANIFAIIRQKYLKSNCIKT